MKLDEIQALVAVDIKIDHSNIDLEAARIPELHNKYLKMFHQARLEKKALKLHFQELYKLKWEYYSGKMSQADLTSKGWSPFPHKILRQDIDVYLNGDKDLLKLQANIDLADEKIDFLESVTKLITQRQWMLRNIIDWRKFTNGIS